MKLNPQYAVIPFLLFLIFVAVAAAESKDLYKILGVERNASQRDIQKAFHRLSLKYHPDKNPAKSAQTKFAEINNAYEVLSDEEKRKNYDLFGDDQGRPRGPDAGAYSNAYAGSQHAGGYTGSQGYHFTYTTKDKNRYVFEDQSHQFGGDDGSYGQGGFFNFPFGNGFGRQEGASSFRFGGQGGSFQNIFDTFFGAAQDRNDDRRGKTFKHTSKDPTGTDSTVKEITPKVFQKEVLGQSYTWAILYTDGTVDVQQRLKVLEQISNVLHGSIKVGHISCEIYASFCEEQKIRPTKASKLQIYSLRKNGKLSALEYTGDWSEKDLKNYCVEALPKVSKQIENIDDVEAEDVPQAILLTRKKDAPAIWRSLSGLLNGRLKFFHFQVRDDNADAIRKQLNVDGFPAIVGVYQNGDMKILSSGVSLEKSGSLLDELKSLLEEFERKSKAAGTGKKKMQADGEVITLTKKNFRDVCATDMPVCLIGVYKSKKDIENVKNILKNISQKSLVRRGQRPDAVKTPVTFLMLDGTKQATFLKAFDDSFVRSNAAILIAYKPKKSTFVAFRGPLTLENSENFVVEVLSGSLQLNRVKRDPQLE